MNGDESVLFLSAVNVQKRLDFVSSDRSGETDLWFPLPVLEKSSVATSERISVKEHKGESASPQRFDLSRQLCCYQGDYRVLALWPLPPWLVFPCMFGHSCGMRVYFMFKSLDYGYCHTTGMEDFGACANNCFREMLRTVFLWCALFNTFDCFFFTITHKQWFILQCSTMHKLALPSRLFLHVCFWSAAGPHKGGECACAVCVRARVVSLWFLLHPSHTVL